MRPLSLLIILPFCAVPALAQPDEAPPMPRRGGAVAMQGVAPTPTQLVQGTVRSFFEALNGDNVYFQGLDWVANVRDVGYFGGPSWASHWQKDRGTLRLEAERADNIEVTDLKTDTAHVKVTYAWGNRALGVRTQPITEELNLKIGLAYSDKKPRWQIVPPATLEEALQMGGITLPAGANTAPIELINMPILNISAVKIASPLTSWQLVDNRNAANKAQAQQSMSNLKQLGLATLMFTQDYDEVFAFAPQFYRDALTPYLKNNDVFIVPQTGESYTFNGNLSKLSIGKLNSPAQTILFYEGQNETPVFRYDGRAAILFADGHVKLVTPDEAKTLIWKP